MPELDRFLDDETIRGTPSGLAGGAWAECRRTGPKSD